MSSSMIFVVAAVGVAGLSSLIAGGLVLANSKQATAPSTFSPGVAPPDAAGSAPQANPIAPTQSEPSAGSAPQANPFVSQGANAAVASPSQPVPIKPAGTTKPAPKKVQFQKPRTAKPRKPTPKTTAPAGARTKQECSDAVYNWFNGEVWPGVDKNVGYSTDTKWYDPSDSAAVRAACGGCIKKDEYGVTIGKAVGVKRYNDEWDDTKRSNLWDEGTRRWIASYITSDLPGTCS